jgi:hypothetical protein
VSLPVTRVPLPLIGDLERRLAAAEAERDAARAALTQAERDLYELAYGTWAGGASLAKSVYAQNAHRVLASAVKRAALRAGGA